MTELFLRVVNMSITAGWLVLAVLALRLMLKKAPKWVSVLLWGLVAVRLICPVSLESVWSLVPSAETFPEKVLSGSSFSVKTGISPVDTQVNTYLDNRYFEGGTVPVNDGWSIMTVAAIVWILGMAVLFLYAALSYGKLYGKVRTAVRLRDHIFQSEYVRSPFVMGFFRPKIYLPYRMDAGNMEYVIAHEQAHIRRRDYWWKLAGFLLLSVYWFHPLMWLAYLLLCRDIEFACDEKAVAGFDAEQRAAYSQALLSSSVPQRKMTACPLAFGEVGVKERVKAVLRYRKPAFWLIAVGIIACVVVGICFLTNPITPNDTLCLNQVEQTGRTHSANFSVSLGRKVGSGEIRAEYWKNGECVQSAPVTFTGLMREITVTADIRNESGSPVGVETYIDTDQYGGVLATYFPFPENESVIGWSFCSYREGERLPMSPGESRVLAAMAFDTGHGVRSMDCETLSEDFEQLKSGNYLVIRAEFYDTQLAPQGEAETGLPMEILREDDIVSGESGDEKTLSRKEGQESVEENIPELLEKLCVSPRTYARSVEDYLAVHPEEYQKLVENGEETLRYCFSEFQKGDQTDLRGEIMAQVCRDILAEWGMAKVDFIYANGQAWFDQFQENSYEFVEQYTAKS